MIQKVGRYRLLESFDLPFLATDCVRVGAIKAFLGGRKSEMGLPLQQGRREALILSESSPATTFSRYLTCGCNSHIRMLVLPQVIPASFLVSPAADLSARVVWVIPTIPPNTLCQHLQPEFLLFPAMSLVLSTGGRP
jgi:hypothetical protein